MDFETILYETEGGKARITLNRPEKLNALSMKLQRELNAALWEADNDTAIHVIILRGAGRAFSAGYDLTPLQSPARRADKDEAYTSVYRGVASFEDDAWQLERQQRERLALWDVHKPVIAQIHGYCLAGGTDLALLCDIVVAADDAVIGFPPVRAMGSPVGHMWTYLVGPQWAKYFLLTGDSVSGREAAEIGLVWRSVPADALEAEVEALASKMEMIEVELLAPNKRIVNVALEMMGARTIQRMAAEMDARAHQAPAVREFGRLAMTEGLKAALEWRDRKFGDSRGSSDYQKRRAEQEARVRQSE
ncbi:MAG TPA: crotonase/enoyl-CoA hydratase family protein [Dehalococcoidia bacterium]|nr:crotonase/enoyl-CoA hydratase family protein [Dehalococcoidia bacterium]